MCKNSQQQHDTLLPLKQPSLLLLVAYQTVDVTTPHDLFLQMRTSVNSLAWTPEGRRCITGTQSGEFTLWNGTQFNFETIIQVNTLTLEEVYFVRRHSDPYLGTAFDTCYRAYDTKI